MLNSTLENDIDYWALLIEQTIKQRQNNGEFIDWRRDDMSEWGVYNELTTLIMSLYDSIMSKNQQEIMDYCTSISVIALSLGSHAAYSLYKLRNAQGVKSEVNCVSSETNSVIERLES